MFDLRLWRFLDALRELGMAQILKAKVNPRRHARENGEGNSRYSPNLREEPQEYF